MTDRPWWVRPGLDIDATAGSPIAGRDAEALARENGTPLFVYDLTRLAENARRSRRASHGPVSVHRSGSRSRPTREPEVLEVLRALGGPAARRHRHRRLLAGRGGPRAGSGWRPEEISFTGTNVSERDLDVLLAHRVHLNLDAISQIERVGRRRRSPGRRIGLRVNPGAGAGYHEGLRIAATGRRSSGSTPDRLDEAIAVAAAS